MGDHGLVARAGRQLATGSVLELFTLLCDEDSRVIAAAHECAMLRYGYLAAIAAEALGFDAHERDDLVQRTFLDLPRAVRRATHGGVRITNPEGWLRRRAYLIGHQMLREEHGSPLRAPVTGTTQRDEQGRILRTRGVRVPVEVIDDAASRLEHSDTSELERAELVHAALHRLSEERPLWAQIIRMHHLDGLALDEIARRLDRTHGTVRNDIHRARARLRALIDQGRALDAAEQRRDTDSGDG
jgi:RNA polymerase sigma factor (sigma-70 family)